MGMNGIMERHRWKQEQESACIDLGLKFNPVFEMFWCASFLSFCLSSYCPCVVHVKLFGFS
jgi:hypothetical protein